MDYGARREEQSLELLGERGVATQHNSNHLTILLDSYIVVIILYEFNYWHRGEMNSNEFIKALKRHDNKIVEQCLQEGLDPNGLDEKGFSYLQNAISDHNEKGVWLLLEYGADPNWGKNASPLQMAIGDVKIVTSSFNIAQMLVLFGATHGGWSQHQLSDGQKERLDQIRKDYIKNSENIVNIIQSKLDPNIKLGAYDFFNKIATSQVAERYGRLDQKYKLIVDKDIAEIQEKAFAQTGKLESLGNWIKSFFVYIEASHYKEVHLRWDHACNIITLHTKPVEDKTVLVGEGNITEVEKFALIGENSDEVIHNPFE